MNLLPIATAPPVLRLVAILVAPPLFVAPLSHAQQSGANDPPRAVPFLPFLKKKEPTAPATQPVYTTPPPSPAPEIRRAVPFTEPVGTPQPSDLNPTPVVRPEVIDPATGAPQTAPLPDSIAPPPGGAREDSFEYANMVYSYQHYDLAVRQFTQFLQENPQSPNSEAAWYRLGESYKKLRNEDKAEECYRTLIRYYPQGQFSAAASYRLADISYRRGDYRTAARNFQIAEGRSSQPEIQLSATYYRARSLQQLKDLRAAIPLYQSLVAQPENNPYAEPAMLFLARMTAESGEKELALQQFLTLKESATSPSIEAESSYTLASLYSELGENEKALQLYQEVLDNENAANAFRPLAFFALIFNHYNAGNYNEVIEIYKTGAFDLDDEARAKLLLMVGNSYRNLEKFTDAIQVYNVVEKYYSHTEEGQEAGYRRLLCFHDAGDPNLGDYVDYYVEQQQSIAPFLPYIDNAYILKAERLFDQALTLQNSGEDAQELYFAAADSYLRARPQNLSDELRAARYYRLGWAQTESAQPQAAIDSFTEFIVTFRDDPKVPSALAKRALAYKSLQDTTSALSDLKRITDNHPDSEIAEFAYQQTALIHGQQRNLQEMVDAFESLLEHFPESKGAAEAQFWIGYGNFELQQYQEAVKPLDAARKLDSVEYHDRATPLIIRAYYNLQQVEPLRKEVSDLLEIKAGVGVPPQVLAWLGVQLFDQADFEGAERFLTEASDPKAPDQTDPAVWQHLAKTRIELKDYKGAVQASDFYLASVDTNSARARALLDKSIALSGMKEFAKATAAAEDALNLEKQGRVNALARLQLGDVAMDEGLPDQALKHYTVVSQIFIDPQITPLALEKAALAHEKSGDTAMADELRAQRREKFPEYKPDEPTL